MLKTLFHAGCFTSLVFVLSNVAMGQAQLPGIHQAREETWVEQAHEISLALFACALDNGGAYPDGQSSTEVFQKLLDGKYVPDPAVFYLDLPGKSKAGPGQKLKPENVCFDLTSGLDSSAPDGLPVVFLTGYKVTYSPGTPAVPLAKPFVPGIVVAYKSDAAKFMKIDTTAGPDGSVPNFIPPTFDAQGKTYRQLTPDGSTSP